jgi:hypothetical protein
VDGEVRLGEDHRAGHALRVELVEAIADDREPGRAHRVEAALAQRLGVRHLGQVRWAVVPLAQQMDSVHQSSP